MRARLAALRDGLGSLGFGPTNDDVVILDRLGEGPRRAIAGDSPRNWSAPASMSW